MCASRRAAIICTLCRVAIVLRTWGVNWLITSATIGVSICVDHDSISDMVRQSWVYDLAGFLVACLGSMTYRFFMSRRNVLTWRLLMQITAHGVISWHTLNHRSKTNILGLQTLLPWLAMRGKRHKLANSFYRLFHLGYPFVMFLMQQLTCFFLLVLLCNRCFRLRADPVSNIRVLLWPLEKMKMILLNKVDFSRYVLSHIIENQHRRTTGSYTLFHDPLVRTNRTSSASGMTCYNFHAPNIEPWACVSPSL